jgi:hypothetical protein
LTLGVLVSHAGGLGVQNEPGQMVGGEPVAQVGGQEEGLVGVAAQEVVGHGPSYPFTTLAPNVSVLNCQLGAPVVAETRSRAAAFLPVGPPGSVQHVQASLNLVEGQPLRRRHPATRIAGRLLRRH